MALTSTAHTITTTRSQIASTDNDRSESPLIWVHADSHGGSEKIVIGGSTVTMATGIGVAGGSTFGPIQLRLDDTLWAISDSATGLSLRVLKSGE